MERAYAVPADRPVKVFLESADAVQEFDIAPVDQFKLMIDEFCREIRLGLSSMMHYEEDLLSQARTLEAGRSSHSVKRPIHL